ncbi:Major Facilitator Superfamily protein [Asanoa hainanensis]|uniref:Major Facilitator Superfamily protein n=1 Tax=Asanoa hainanensis TaxID=560556 RepID=A0A239N7C3_9ACTN|nr:MFS transporter [Asanoa hainanensis]SNT50383.1 Major Facilitator Superfamily protein [Asanoa hainanensis]
MLPRPFWFLWFGTLINRFGYFVVPFLTLYLVRHRGFDPALAGAVVSAFGAGSLVSQPLGGWLADRAGRRPTLVAGLLATAAAYLALGAAASPAVLVGCAAAAGLATDLYRPAVAAVVADLVAPEHQRRAFALLYWAIVAATRDPRLVGLTASTFAVAVVFFQGFVTLPLAMSADGLDAGAYGLVAALNPAVILLCQPVLVRLVAGVPLTFLYAGSGVATGVGFGLRLAADSIAGYAVTVAVWTLGEIALNIAAPAMLAVIAPAYLRGRYQGVWGSSWGLALLVAPVAGTWTWQRFGAGPLWLGCLALASAGTSSLLVWRSRWTAVDSRIS